MIRAAAREDARAIAELEVRAWRWAFVDLVADEDMPAVAEREERWRSMSLDGAFVAEVGGRIVGVVRIGPDSAGGAAGAEAGRVGRLRGLYVDPAAQGAGLGTALHEHAIAALVAAGFAEATLEVFAANGHARGFYERRGWAVDGPADDWAGVAGIRCRHRLRG